MSIRRKDNEGNLFTVNENVEAWQSVFMPTIGNLVILPLKYCFNCIASPTFYSKCFGSLWYWKTSPYYIIYFLCTCIIGLRIWHVFNITMQNNNI